MTRTTIAALAVGVLVAAGACSSQPQDDTAGVDVDLVYLNHPPVQPVLRDIDKILAGYEGKIDVARYDADSPEGKEFADEHQLTGHVAVAILIDGKVTFKGFPTGTAPVQSVEGDWKIEDLDAALKQRTTNG